MDSFDNVDYDRDSDDDVQTVSVPESVLEAFTDADSLSTKNCTISLLTDCS